MSTLDNTEDLQKIVQHGCYVHAHELARLLSLTHIRLVTLPPGGRFAGGVSNVDDGVETIGDSDALSDADLYSDAGYSVVPSLVPPVCPVANTSDGHTMHLICSSSQVPFAAMKVSSSVAWESERTVRIVGRRLMTVEYRLGTFAVIVV